jgi:hypothetical protein
VVRTIRIRKSRRMAHIYFLLKNTVKEGILDIQLTKRPTTRNSQREQNADSHGLDHRTEGILVVKAISLLEPLSNPACLVPLNRTISMCIHLENPFAVNDINTRPGGTRVHVPFFMRA